MSATVKPLRRGIAALACAVLTMVGLVVAGPVALGATTLPSSEQYRPYLHYSPTKNWMNDPNGLVYYQGVYHLFYQYNPFGNTWGNMSWGHATSTDLLHWTEQPLALPQDADADIFSGSIVVDKTNTSGFGTASNPPLVAMYTTAYHTGKQAQSLAYSTNAGQTWTKYAGNPVLDRNSNNFRDPHVFRYQGTGQSAPYWVVVTVEANDHQVLIYKSTDLKSWTYLSTFGPANAVGGQWECPDLFPLAVDGDPNNVKWVMSVNLNPGAVGGGSGAQYFVGNFDGSTFTSQNTVGSNTLPPGTTFAGFDSGSYSGWTATNEPGHNNGPFGAAPATGTLAGQTQVTGFAGSGLINSFTNGDLPTGTLESPDFTVTQSYLNFLVGGGRHPWQSGTSAAGADPAGTVFNDFESTGWGTWQATGGLTGAAPVTGALSGQSPVTGFRGNSLLNTFLNGDGTVGTLTSPTFTINSGAVNFLIGGGNHPWGQPGATALNLVVNGQVVRSTTGKDSENTTWQGWDVSGLQGQQATLQAVDNNAGGWGHLLLDQVVFADKPVTTFADFEGPTWGVGWTATGDFSSAGPARGSLSGQLPVTGYEGGQLVDTFTKGDSAIGTINGPTFTVNSNYIDMLVGGGNHPWGQPNPTSVNLVINGQVVKSATGRNSEDLDWVFWDVSQYQGQQASIQIEDQNQTTGTGSWGHINVDQITFSGYQALPRSTATAVNLVVNGSVVRTATGSDSENLDWASWNVSEFAGQRAHISVVDGNRGQWGHILADQFMLANTAALPRLQSYGWIDWGRDYYAGVTYDNAPDNKRIMIAWMNNWDYANQIPTGEWRSAMALPRELALKTINGRPQLVQKVVDQISGLERTAPYTRGPSAIAQGATPLPSQAQGNVLEVDAVFSAGTASKFGLTVLQSADGTEGTPVLYDTATSRLTVDRTRSGDTSFNPSFSSVESAPVTLENGKLYLKLYLDRSSVEVFAQDGKATITDQVFPKDTSTGLSLISEGGVAQLERLSVTPLARAMWQEKQTITFAPLGDRVLGERDFPVSASASSGLPVTFAASGSCSVNETTVHLSGAGACTITASQPGNDTFAAATEVARTFTVADNDAPTVTVSTSPSVPNGRGGWYVSPVTLSASAADTNDTAPVLQRSTDSGASWSTYAPVVVSAPGATSVQFRAVDKYGAVSEAVTATVEVDPSAPTVSLGGGPLGSVTFGNVPDNATCVASDDGSGVASCVVTGYSTAVGDHTLTATATDQAGNVATVNRTYTVVRAEQTITLSAMGSATFGDPDITVSALASSGLPATLAASGACTLAATAVHLTGAGECTVTATQAGNGNYLPAPDEVRTFAIGKADQTVGFSAPAVKTFGDDAFNVSASATSGLPVEIAADGACTINGSTVSLTGGGICQLTASQIGDANYNPADDVRATIAVGKASQTITFQALVDKTFGDSDFTVSATASSGLPVTVSASGSCTVVQGVAHLTGAGTCTLTASQSGDTDFKAATSLTRTLAVAKADQYITVSAAGSATFGDPDITLVTAASSGLPVTLRASGACTLADTTLHVASAGECTLTATQPGNGDYNAAPTEVRTFTVQKATQAITFTTPASKTFGDADFSVAAVASSDLPVSVSASGACTISGTTVHVAAAGICQLVASQPGDGNYNPADDVFRAVPVGKAGQTITFPAISDRLFGDPDFAVAPSASSGLPVTVTGAGACTLAQSQVHLISAGTCTLTGTQAGNGDFTPAPVVTKTFTVAPYAFRGFYQPVDLNAVNTAKGGSTIPITFEVLRGSVELTDLSEISSINYASIPSQPVATTDEIETLATGATSLKYDTSAGRYQYNWKTPTAAGNYRLTVKTRDGAKLTADFRLR